MSKKNKKYDDDSDLVGDEDEKKTSVAILNIADIDREGTLFKLTKEEKDICSQLHQRGSADYLRFELGWTATKIKDFIARKGVIAELEYLSRAYSQREGIQERAQFFAVARINSMVPAALGIIARALRGDKINENDGSIDRAPTRGQFEAAIEILERANIKGAKYKGEDSAPVIDARSVSVTLGEMNSVSDPVNLSSRNSRDTVRNFMSSIMSRLEDDGGKRRKGTAKGRGSVPVKHADGESDEGDTE